MFRKYSKQLAPQSVVNRGFWVIGIVLWVFGGFFGAQIIVTTLVGLSKMINVPLGSLDSSILETVLAALIYLVTLALVIGLPWLVRKQRTTLTDVGLQRLPNWTDVIMAPAGLIVYLAVSSILVTLAINLLPWFNVSQPQDTGFYQTNYGYEVILAFVTLVIIAPIAEEIIFRGYLFGRLKKYAPVWVAIVVTSVVFGALHGAWNLAVDTFALSVVMCLLRQNTGSLWASILLHMSKNGLAFYILFINPTFLHTLGL
jgi:membrane protease YdiL (CAAX protease family)